MSSEASGFRVEVVSPERVLYSGEATQVITRTLGGGEIAFLPGHVAFLGALVENHTRVYETDGKVLDVARRVTEGYLRGVVRFDGLDEYRGSAAHINFQNEWIVAYRDGQPLAMTPDLICVLDTVSGEAVGSETVRYGQRVTIVALPPPAVFLTPKGLDHVGPRAFGYDLEFRSVFSS